MLEIMVFLKKNAKFMPSVEEVVFEMKRKKQAAKDAKRAAAKATKAASSSSSSTCLILTLRPPCQMAMWRAS